MLLKDYPSFTAIIMTFSVLLWPYSELKKGSKMFDEKSGMNAENYLMQVATLETFKGINNWFCKKDKEIFV